MSDSNFIGFDVCFFLAWTGLSGSHPIKSLGRKSFKFDVTPIGATKRRQVGRLTRRSCDLGGVAVIVDPCSLKWKGSFQAASARKGKLQTAEKDNDCH